MAAPESTIPAVLLAMPAGSDNQHLGPSPRRSVPNCLAMAQNPPAVQNTLEKYLEETDLVKIRSLGVLATVEHIGGESSSDDDDSDADVGSPLMQRYVLEPGGTIRTETFEDDHVIAENYAREMRRRGLYPMTDEDDSSVNTDTGHDTDHDAHADEDNEHMDDDQVGPEVPVGSALVTRLDNGDDAVVPITDLEVVDRAFAPGQLVLSAKPADPNLQSGAIQDIRKTLIVRRLSKWDETDESFEVPGEQLSFFSDVRVDGYITMGNWLGVVEYIQEDVYVDFPDGSVAVVQGHSDSGATQWLEGDDPRVSPRRNPDAEGFFFPGMKVKAAARIWRDASWVRGRYRRQRSGTVRTTKIINVGVQWMAIRQNLDPASYDPQPLPPPPDVVPYEDVRPLEAFRSLWWRAGDRALLTSEVPADEEPWVESSPTVPPTRDERASARPSRSARVSRRHQRGRLITALRRAREVQSLDEQDVLNAPATDPAAVLQIVGTRSYVDVMWQDGSLEKDVPSIHLRPNEHPGAYDFWPGLVVGKGGEDADPLPAPPAPAPGSVQSAPSAGGQEETADAGRNYLSGVVVRALLDEKTAFVRWQKPNSREYMEEEEEHSFYDLMTLNGYDMQLGDTVLLTSREPSVQAGAPAGDPRWVGEIVGRGVGDIKVRWLGGGVSSVFPDQIIVVSDADQESEGADEEEESEFEGDTDEDGMGNERAMNDPQFRANWEITDADDAGAAILDELESVLRQSTAYSGGFPLQLLPAGPADVAALVARYPLLTKEGTIPRKNAVQLARSIGTVLVGYSADSMAFERTGIAPADGRHQSWVDAKELIGKAITAKIATMQDSDVHMQNSTASTVQTDAVMNDANASAPQGTDANPASDGTETKAPSSSAGASADPAKGLSAPRFEVVEKFEAHFYASRSASATGQANRPGFASIVVKEYSRLKRNLPAGIHVHGSESQHDLLRASIVGPRDTPYENILFFFDIFLPMQYPAEPPKVHFWSHGRRLNPNLYEDGKVCLSILGTWDGDGVEQWDARTSNVLRVLLSLQAMVFVEQPYYNEAGYEKQVGTVEGKTNSRTYSESTLLLCMRHLMQSNRAGGSPTDYEELRREHYGMRKGDIVKRIRKLSCMEKVEGDAEGVKDQEELQYTSRGFKKSLKELTARVEQSLNSVPPWSAA